LFSLCCFPYFFLRSIPLSPLFCLSEQQGDQQFSSALSSPTAPSSPEDHSLSLQYSLSSNISLAATSVLESLISRLYESGFPLNNPTESTDMSRTEQEIFLVVNEQLSAICEEIAPHVVQLSKILMKLLANYEYTKLTFQTKTLMPRLGNLDVD
jgi:hypothetical protein